MTDIPDFDQIADRHVSLGKALEDNDVQWARSWLAHATKEDPHTLRTLAVQLQKVFFTMLPNMTPDTADFLIEQGVDTTAQHEVHLPDRREVVGLPRLLIDNGNDDLFKHLFERGAINLEQRSVGGDGLLAQALNKENLDLAKWLLDRGADINQPNFLGMTPLHQAANRVNCLAVEWLMEHGADPEIETLEGSSVASQLVPEIDDTGVNDMLYEALEDYSQSFIAGDRAVPVELASHCNQLRAQCAKQEASAEGGHHRTKGPGLR